MSKTKSEIVLRTNVSEAGREEASTYQSIIGNLIPRPLGLRRHFISIEDINNIRTIVYASGTNSTAFYDWSELKLKRGISHICTEDRHQRGGQNHGLRYRLESMVSSQSS